MGTCSSIQVQSGNTCATLATRCGISGADFTSYNPSTTECSTLTVGEYVCCSAGTLPDLAPPENANGSCFVYYVQPGDYCAALAATYTLTVAQLESFNTETWGWMGCDDLQADMNMCLSTGTPPMPAPISNAICGPQVPGTAAPAAGVSLASLNQCPLNACCDIYGQCGTTAEFCTASSAASGAPGTAAPGGNGCISNCGTNIVQSGPPAEFISVAYFEGFADQRSCLNTMYVTDIDPTKYTHVHLAFAGISTTYDVDISAIQDHFDLFAALTGIKRVLSFGGWSFSTSQDTSPIFADSVSAANRQTFISNIVAFVAKYDLDGVDFDWEYPGATDIPGLVGHPDDGINYLVFLAALREALPSTVSISLAAPAGYWYLRNFPIAWMQSFVDYIVFMTYDLHGQWDYGALYSDSSCPSGNCLRSHVNLTETFNAMSMITKAGVASNKVVMGVSSYGRSFEMTTPGCTGPLCTFTGPASGATPGPCTKTAGYIADAEINAIIAAGGNIQTFTDASYSNILVYNNNQWVSYMTDDNKAIRTLYYQDFDFGGTSDWAVDLQQYYASRPVPNADGTCASHLVEGGDTCVSISEKYSLTTATLAGLNAGSEYWNGCSSLSVGTPVCLSLGSKAVSSSDSICNLEWTTALPTSLKDANDIISATWSSSGAGTYLNTFLTDYKAAHGNLEGWLLSFFETVVPDSLGGSIYDCSDLQFSSCIAPLDPCQDYTPPEAYFVHVSISLLFNKYKSFYQAIVNNAVTELAVTIDTISNTFAPPDNSASELFSIITSVLTTAAGLGVLAGDADVPIVGALGDGISAFSTLFAAVAPSGTGTVTEQLSGILGTTLETVLATANDSVTGIFNPTASNSNITFIESFFLNGAFLDSQLVVEIQEATLSAYNNTMNQYLIVQAMQAVSTFGYDSYGYVFLYSTADTYNTADECNALKASTAMYWDDVDNICIGFGELTTGTVETGDGTEDEEVTYTTFLSSDLWTTFQSLVPDPNAAANNNYACSKQSSTATVWTNGFDPSLQIPACLFNFPAYPILPRIVINNIP